MTNMRVISVLAVLAIIGSCQAARSVGNSRQLLVSVSGGDTNISYNLTQSIGNAPVGADDLSQTDMRIAKQSIGLGPDQVHVVYWGNNSYLFSWATGDGIVGPQVNSQPATAAKSQVFIGTSSNSYTINTTGIALTYTQDYSRDNFLVYTSPILHHTLVTDLKPGTTYYYRVGDDRYWNGVSDEFNFTTVGDSSSLPFKIGVIADVGQTSNTTLVLDGLKSAKPQAVILSGDFSYADNYQADGCGYQTGCPKHGGEATNTSNTYQPRWDTWSRLMSPLWSQSPLIFASGNHEIEETPNGNVYQALNARYLGPNPGIYNMDQQLYLQNFAGRPNNWYDPYGSLFNMFYSVEVPGATVINLSSMIPNDTFDNTTVQYQWLEKTLSQVDRTRTPWIIVNFHFPWYSSYGSYKQNECMRINMEPLLYKYGADLVFNGHVHAYERTNSVYNLTNDPCGAVHITMGDAGNGEKLSTTFFDQNIPSFCYNNTYETRTFPLYQPGRCFTMNPGTNEYCDFKQPAWSAYRSPSFGYGMLEIMNATTARWTWTHTGPNPNNIGDDVYITRTPDKCSNKN